MKKQVIVLAMLVALVPGVASAVTVAFDFTGSGSAWTPSRESGPAAVTYEMGGDPTKMGYESTTELGYITLWQEIFAPAGWTMENIKLDAVLRGYSSWIALARMSLSTAMTTAVPEGTLWDQQPAGSVGGPVQIDATGNVAFADGTSVWVGVEVYKGLTNYTPIELSQVVLSYDLVPEPGTISMFAMAFAAMLLRKKK